MDKARKRRFKVDWEIYQVPKPKKQGIQIFYDYPLTKIVDYIDWSPFFHAWELKGTYPSILKSNKYGTEANKLYADAKRLLNRIISDKQLIAKAVFGIYPAHSKDESVYTQNTSFYFPRQLIDKGIDRPNYSLADFIAPEDDFIGLFAVTTLSLIHI